MEKKARLIEIFQEMGLFLELSGENPFKVRAYENAVRALEGSPLSLEEVREKTIPGFGKGLQEKLAEFLQNGKIGEHQNFLARFPGGLFDLLKVQGLGPKKVKVLYEELKISSLEDLQTACEQNKIRGLKGFGEKTQQNILEGLGFLKKFKGQYLFVEAEEIAESVIRFLRAEFPDTQFTIAGSLRRKKEIVRDIDILAASEDPGHIMAHFTRNQLAAKVLSEGRTKSSILTPNGLQVDLRVVSPGCFGPALCHFTGSKEHNTRMRGLALAQGMKLNEYGLFQDEKCPPMTREEEVFAKLGLDYIPPELREDMGEVVWAQNRTLPGLVQEKDIKGILHFHTTASDGRASLEQMVKAGMDAGFSWMGVTDHSRSAFYANGLSIDAVKAQWQQIDDLNVRFPKFRVLKGIESDIHPNGSLDYPTEILAGFDFIIGSIHSHFSKNPEETNKRLLQAFQNPFMDILGHPSGRLLLERSGYEMDMERILEGCRREKVIVEINANPCRLDLDWRHIRMHRGRGLYFAIGPDAHSLDGVRDVRFGVGIARKGALDHGEILNCLSATEFLDFISSRRKK